MEKIKTDCNGELENIGHFFFKMSQPWRSSFNMVSASLAGLQSSSYFFLLYWVRVIPIFPFSQGRWIKSGIFNVILVCIILTSKLCLSYGATSTIIRTFVICYHRTPVHAAAFNDQVECLQLLLSRGGNVDSMDQSGRTPLIMAADNGHAGAVGEPSVQCICCALTCRHIG